MKHIRSYLVTAICAAASVTGFAQQANRAIKAGNEAYKKADYKTASKLYKNALTQDNNNTTAKFNLANAFLKQNNIAEAMQYYNQVLDEVQENSFRAQTLYNKGLTLIRGHKLPDAIEAFKQSLLLAPEDNDTRENLQKAISELKKQQQNQPQPQNNKKPPEPKKQKNKQPDKEMMEQKFDELRDKEKQLQKQLQKKDDTEQPEKDW